MNDYENAKACYRRFGVDVERALAPRQQATTPAKPVILKS